MKVGAISDLHFDMHENSDNLINTFITEMNKKSLDVLIIAGDITENVDKTINIVDTLVDKIQSKVYYVPGNHDLWNKNNHSRQTTREIYERYKKHDNCLVDSIKHFGEYTIIGDVFWYDYSLANQNRYTKKQLQQRELNQKTWKDKLYVNWQETDPEVTNQFIDKANQTLAKLDGQKTILVSHMINHPKFCVPVENRKQWEYFNAFLGSKSLYVLIKKHNIKLSICGHVHYRKTIEEHKNTFICSCLGYQSEWKLFDNASDAPEYQINQALKIIKL